MYQSMTKDFYCVWRISTSLRDFRWIRDKNCVFLCKDSYKNGSNLFQES